VVPAGARHVDPEEFHAMLAEAAAPGGNGDTIDGSCGKGNSSSGEGGSDGRGVNGAKETVLIDARNFYETRIGHFEAVGVAREREG